MFNFIIQILLNQSFNYLLDSCDVKIVLSIYKYLAINNTCMIYIKLFISSFFEQMKK